MRTQAISLLRSSGLFVPVQRAHGRLRKLIGTASDLPPVADALRRWRRAHPTLRTQVRSDPVPELCAFPPARYVFMVERIARDFGGRPASLFARARLFQQHAGVTCEILMV